jgi:ubiquinone/menaquinone biosynthesis C-methylase UbiE
MNDAEVSNRFPRSSRYNFDWIKEGAMGSNVLWMTEWLCERLDLRQGMRVLDLGCGKGEIICFFGAGIRRRSLGNGLMDRRHGELAAHWRRRPRKASFPFTL